MTDVASGSHSDSGSYVQEAKVSKFNFGKDVTVDHIATSTAATYSYQYIQSNSADLIVEGGAYFDTEHTQTATTINISSNVKENKSHFGGSVLRGDHVAVPGFHGDIAPLSGLARQNPIPAGCAGAESRGHHRFAGGDNPLRKDLLLSDLPSWRVPRWRR